MYSLLVREMTIYTFTQAKEHSLDMVEIYRWVMGKKVSITGCNLGIIVKTD